MSAFTWLSVCRAFCFCFNVFTSSRASVLAPVMRVQRWICLILLLLLLNVLSETDGASTESTEEDADAAQSKPGAKQPKPEVGPSAVEILNGIVRALGYFIGWIPWTLLFLCAWDGSIVPKPYFDDFFGKIGVSSTYPFEGMLKYIMIPGFCVSYMSLLDFLRALPPKVKWDFPNFCVQPRTFWGIIAIHQAPLLHISSHHYAMTCFYMWLVGATVLSYGRRTFVFSTYFIAFVGHFAFWCMGSETACIVGYMPVIFGYWGMLLSGICVGIAGLFKCPPPGYVIVRCLFVFFVSVFLTEYFWLLFSDQANAKVGEHWLGHVCGFSSGFVFGCLHFGLARCSKNSSTGFGIFVGFEKSCRSAGSPWPGWHRFLFRALKLLVFDFESKKQFFSSKDEGIELICF